MSGPYDKGDMVRCRAAFTTRQLSHVGDEIETFRTTGVLPVGIGVDPASVVFRYKKPDGTVASFTYGTNPELVRVATGSYYVDLNANQANTWIYRFEGTGINQAAEETEFAVNPSAFS